MSELKLVTASQSCDPLAVPFCNFVVGHNTGFIKVRPVCKCPGKDRRKDDSNVGMILADSMGKGDGIRSNY